MEDEDSTLVLIPLRLLVIGLVLLLPALAFYSVAKEIKPSAKTAITAGK